MATKISPVYDTISTVTISPASVATGSARVAAAFDNSAVSPPYDEIEYFVQTKTGASGVSATGTIPIRAAGSIDGGTTYTGNVGGSDATKTGFPNCPLIGTLVDANANATSCYGGPFCLSNAFPGGIPPLVTILLDNESGAALDSTAGNHIVKQRGIWYQNA